MSNSFVAWPTPLTLDANSNLVLTAGIKFPLGSQINELANGSIQFTDSTGVANDSIVIGPVTSDGVKIEGGSGNVTITAGNGTGVYLKAAVFAGYNTNSAAAPLFIGPGASTGLYFPTATSLGLSTNGVAALTFDASQNATFAGTVSGVTSFHAGSFAQTALSDIGIAMVGRQVVAASAAITLTATEAHDCLVYCTGTAAFAVTLPAGVVGMHVVIVNNSSAAITLTANGTDTIAATGLVAAASRTIAAGGTMEATFVAAGLWYVNYSVGTVS